MVVSKRSKLFGRRQRVAVSVHRQGMDVMRQAIKQRAGQPFGPQDARPALEGKIGRYEARDGGEG